MGRTKRKRRRKSSINELNDLFKILDLQKSMRIKCSKIKIHYFNGTGWGLKCKVNIQEGDVLIALPLYHLITPAVNCDIFNVLNRETLSSQFILSLFLMYEVHLKSESKHFNYINTLPKTYSNLYFCTEQEVKLLPDFLRDELLTQKLTLKKYFNLLFNITSNKLCPHCKEELRIILDSEKFIWAWFTVNTRSVYYQEDNGVKSMALAPFLDMFNHSNYADTKMSIDFKNNLYILKTLVKYKKSDQVFIKYGAHSNLKLLLEYGFILSDNENDFVEFTLEEIIENVKNINSDFGKISKYKKSFIQSNRLNINLTKSKDCFSWNLNVLICVLITKDQDLSQLQAKIYSNTFTNEEKNLIQKIGNSMGAQKALEFKESLKLMGHVKEGSVSFLLAKNLIEIYTNLLL